MGIRKHVLCGVVCLLLSDVISVVDSTLDLTIPDTALTVKEKGNRQMELSTTPITCADTTDPDKVRVYLKSIYPSNPCGNCFPIWPCPSDIPTGFCVMFTPSLGTLNYQTAKSYTLQVACTDDNGEEVVNTVVVSVLANTPPTFTQPATAFTTASVAPASTKNIRSGGLIYDVNADDADGDGITYTMTSSPSTNRFEIGYGSGEIRATTDLRAQCDPTVAFSVSAADQYNPSVGPDVILVTFPDINQRPVVTNLNTTQQVPEEDHTPVNTLIRTVTVTDGDKYNNIYFRVRAVPEEGLDYYKVDSNGKIQTRTVLDYEYAPLRTVTLYFDVSDPFCKAPTSWLTLQITDVNEKPVLSPNYTEITVYEGFIDIDPKWTAVDPDEGDILTWSRLSGGGGDFDVDDDSGAIFSTKEIDIDPDVEQKVYTLKTRVTDKGGLTADGQVVITVLDKNDNEPIFTSRVYTVTASECTKLGSILSTVTARDLDSHFQGNDLLVYSGTGQYISIMSAGSVVLTAPCKAGVSDDTLAHVTDQGQYPGPLTGVPATVTFSCSECPTPPPPAVVTTTTTRTTTTAAAVASRSRTSTFLDNLAWIVPAILLAIALLATLIYFLWRYCSQACARCRMPQTLVKKSPKNQKANVKPQKPSAVKEKEQLPPPPEQLPPPPEPPQLPEEPFLFGFWKETYTERNQRAAPERNTQPGSVAKEEKLEAIELKAEMAEKEQIAQERQQKIEQYEKEVAEYKQKVNEVRKPKPPQAPPTRKVCTIL